MSNLIKTTDQIERIRVSAKILSKTLKKLRNLVKPGVKLIELDRFAKETILEKGGKPAFLGYRPYGAKEPYPSTLCTSVNDIIVHGRPTNYAVQKGDILKLDLGVNWKGGISDAAITIAVGPITKEGGKLIKTTEKALKEGIRAVKPGHTLGDIGFAIERVATSQNMKIIDGLTGHGVGIELHEDPVVYNFGKPGSGMVLKENMVLAIEPMLSSRTGKIIQLHDDSFATADGSMSAHFEHTILVTKRGAEILTK
ncbi:MAG TPA: type I methionyl aminopeptidase [Candidatus Paceibacterota bacterium]